MLGKPESSVSPLQGPVTEGLRPSSAPSSLNALCCLRELLESLCGKVLQIGPDVGVCDGAVGAGHGLRFCGGISARGVCVYITRLRGCRQGYSCA